MTVLPNGWVEKTVTENLIWIVPQPDCKEIKDTNKTYNDVNNSRVLNKV